MATGCGCCAVYGDRKRLALIIPPGRFGGGNAAPEKLFCAALRAQSARSAAQKEMILEGRSPSKPPICHVGYEQIETCLKYHKEYTDAHRPNRNAGRDRRPGSARKPYQALPSLPGSARHRQPAAYQDPQDPGDRPYAGG